MIEARKSGNALYSGLEWEIAERIHLTVSRHNRSFYSLGDEAQRNYLRAARMAMFITTERSGEKE